MAKKGGRVGRMFAMLGIGSAGLAGGVLVGELGMGAALKIDAFKKWVADEEAKAAKAGNESNTVALVKTGIGVGAALVPSWLIGRFAGKRGGRLAFFLLSLGVVASAFGRRAIDWGEEMADKITARFGEGGVEEMAVRKMHRRMGKNMRSGRGGHYLAEPAGGGVETMQQAADMGGVETMQESGSMGGVEASTAGGGFWE